MGSNADDAGVGRQLWLQAIVEAADDTVIGVGSGAVITRWNARAAALYGYTADEVVGRPLSLLSPPELADEAGLLYGQLGVGQPAVRCATQHLTRAGQRLDIALTLAPLADAAGRLAGAVALVRDTTATTQAARELERSARSMRLLRECRQAVLHATTEPELLATVSRLLVAHGGYRRAEVALAGNAAAAQVAGDSVADDAGARAVPLLHDGDQLGVLTVVASLTEVVDPAELALLGELAQDLAYGLATLRAAAERSRTEEALHASEAQYRELVENANSIILRWNSDGCITFLNEFGQRFFGYTADELLGRSVMGTLVPPTESSGRDLRQLLDQIRTSPLDYGQNVNENMRANGERVWVAWANRVVRTPGGEGFEILSIGTDITERKQAQDALRRSEEQFRLIMDNLADLVVLLDLDGRRIYNSPSYQHILGDPERLRGSSSFAEVHPQDRPRVRQAFEETVRTGVGCRLDYRLVGCDGCTREIESQGSVIRDEQGQVAQVLVVSRDVSERRQAETAIRELNTTLEQRVRDRTAELAVARDQAQEADRLKSAFLASMSHELRTPLNSIIGFTGILLQHLAGPLNDEQRKQLGMVRDSARHLLALINDVLDISKIEAGQIEIDVETFDLREAIDRLAQNITPLADKKQLPLVVDLDPALGCVTSDRRRVEQVLLNLLSNAIKFTEHGCVTLRARLEPGAVCLSVSDTGLGIKPEGLPQLFLPFRQLETGLTRHHEGTGLGLAISKRLVERLGGTIAVESQWGVGSTFSVRLPLGATEQP